jgi:hypothetical protein
VAEDPVGGRADPTERRERMRFLGGQERLRVRGVAEPAAHQYLRQHVRDPERGAEPLGGGVVVGRDGEAGLHAARSVWRAVDGKVDVMTLAAYAERFT